MMVDFEEGEEEESIEQSDNKIRKPLTVRQVIDYIKNKLGIEVCDV